ncbi:hypothetical protein D3C85_743900 [compost metagenome]
MKGPYLSRELSSSSILSGTRIQTAMAMKAPATSQVITLGSIQLLMNSPIQAAPAWLSRVATSMPAMMGQGLRKRQMSSNARSWVLSPISAMATLRVEVNKASIKMTGGRNCYKPETSLRHPSPVLALARQRSCQIRHCPDHPDHGELAPSMLIRIAHRVGTRGETTPPRWEPAF